MSTGGDKLGMSRYSDRMSAQQHTQARLLRYRPAAQYLGVGYSTLRKMIADGIIPTVTITPGGHPMVDRDDLDALVEQSKGDRPTEAADS